MTEAVFITPVGPLRLIAHNERLLYCNWDSDDCLSKLLKIRNHVINNLDTDNNRDEIERKVMEETEAQLAEYFEGKRRVFNLPIEAVGTGFQKNVWKALSEIGYGETLSYSEIARMTGNPKSVRAVANACGANPCAVILPCHRVITHNNTLGGYTGGSYRKRFLLELENAHINFF